MTVFAKNPPPYKIDLHLHSNISDGQNSPAESLLLSYDVGLQVISFVEHNYIADSEVYNLNTRKKIVVIPGVEITTSFDGRTYHLLGYFKKFPNKRINLNWINSVNAYENRAKKIIQQCQNIGVPISYQKIRESYSEIYLSRFAIAEELRKAMNLNTIQEAFIYAKEHGDLFWAADDFVFPNTISMIKLIHDYSGVAILAHPGQSFWFNEKKNWKSEVNTLLSDLELFIKSGLNGLEIYYINHPLFAISTFEDIVKKHNLIFTGGSDWHGDLRMPDHPLGYGGINQKQLEALIEAMN